LIGVARMAVIFMPWAPQASEHVPVMPGLVPGIHVFAASKAWMAGQARP